VEHTLEDNKAFDAQGLLENNPTYKGRLKFWTNELCAQKPQTFDIVLAVRTQALARGRTLTDNPLAWW
jgi:NAD+ kinase